MNWRATVRVPPHVAGLVAIALYYTTIGLTAAHIRGERIGLEHEQLAQLDRLRAVAAYGPELNSSGVHDASSAFAALFLPAGPPAVVSANLLDLLKQMAAMQGIEVLQAEGTPPKQQEALTLVGGKLQMVGPMPSILNLLKAIEDAQPLLIIERLALRKRGPSGDEAAETYLSVELQVTGAMRGVPSPMGVQGD